MEICLAWIYQDEDGYYDMESYPNASKVFEVKDMETEETVLRFESAGREVEIDRSEIEWYKMVADDAPLVEYIRKGNKEDLEWDDEGYLIN